MKRFICMVGILLGFALSVTLDSVLPLEGCDHSEALPIEAQTLISQTESLDMPMENPISYNNIVSRVVSSSYCRSIGKYRFSSIIPTIYEQAPVLRQNFLEPFGDNLLTSNLFSYAAEYFVFGQRRILI